MNNATQTKKHTIELTDDQLNTLLDVMGYGIEQLSRYSDKTRYKDLHTKIAAKMLKKATDLKCEISKL